MILNTPNKKLLLGAKPQTEMKELTIDSKARELKLGVSSQLGTPSFIPTMNHFFFSESYHKPPSHFTAPGAEVGAFDPI